MHYLCFSLQWGSVVNKYTHDIIGKYLAYVVDKKRMYLVDYNGRFHHMGKAPFAQAERYARLLGLPIKVR